MTAPKLHRCLLIAGMLLTLSPWVQADEQRGAHDFVLKSHTGENLRISEYRGSVIVLLFWSTWCAECPELLQSMRERVQPLPKRQARLFVVSVDHDTDLAASTAAEHARYFPMLLDVNQTIAQRFEIETIPSMVLLDRDGREMRRVSGAEVNSFDLAAAVEELLK